MMKLAWKSLPAALAVLASASLAHAATSGPWRDFDESLLFGQPGERLIVPQRYRVVALDTRALRERLASAPMEFTPDANARPLLLELPMPDGAFLHFQVEESPIMEPGLARQLPEIRTYRGQGVEDPTVTTRFGWTGAGFHAIVLGGSGTVYIDPYRRGDTRHYVSYFKRDYRGAPDFRCLFETPEDEPPPDVYSRIPSGATLRTYRLALAANVEYSDFHSTQVPPDKNDVMNNGLIPTMNRVNGIYEREVAARMVMVANELNVIFVVDPDPYTNGNGVAMLGENQATMDGPLMGSANYDIGHVFSTGGGGVAFLRAVCVNGNKARGVTGRGSPVGDAFDVDYVAHEMGHQFGGNHTFNGNAGSCGGGNRNASTAYEVGSGSTIQAYAGICGAQNLQPNSDDYFHNISFVEIQAFTTTGAGNNCPVATPTGNQAPVPDAGAAFNIPSRTPFALTASGTDPDGHPLTFLWEEFDLGPAGSGTTDNGSSPILRSFLPPVGPTRVFPKLSDILNNTVTYGEILPTTTRTMQFRVTARDNRAGGGGVDWDQTSVSVSSSAGPFAITAPNTAVTWPAGLQRTVNWNVAGTSAAPINTASVDIALSTDGGQTFPTSLATGTPNDGSQVITVPSVNTAAARVRVSAVGNVFFDISNANFTITTTPIALAAPAALAVDATGNGVLQPGEIAVAVAPSWLNEGTAAVVAGVGALSAFTGPAGPTYTIPDAAAAYGTINPGSTGSCSAQANCYAVTISSGPRPVQHWDATVNETVTPGAGAKTWTLHVGDSFTDVPAGNPFYRFIETIFHKGVTGGCATGTYCPANPTSREQMAVFVLVAKDGAGYTPPACTTPIFSDVPASNPFCRFIEELVRRGVVSGCATGQYCPAAPVTREQMSIFALRTLDPSLAPPPCVPGSEIFDDVPASSPFCPWIEEMARRGVVSGCAPNLYCPTAPVTREQMGVFLTATFGLTLYGV